MPSSELQHLLNRAIDGVALHGEADHLRRLVAHLEQRVAQQEAVIQQAELNAEQQARHFQTLSGERESYRQAWKAEQKQRATAEARGAELTAGQCTHALAVCEQHHRVPVADCPYPRCVAARKQQEADR